MTCACFAVYVVIVMISLSTKKDESIPHFLHFHQINNFLTHTQLISIILLTRPKIIVKYLIITQANGGWYRQRKDAAFVRVMVS